MHVTPFCKPFPQSRFDSFRAQVGGSHTKNNTRIASPFRDTFNSFADRNALVGDFIDPS